MYMIYALIRIYNTRDLDTSPAYLKQYMCGPWSKICMRSVPI